MQTIPHVERLLSMLGSNAFQIALIAMPKPYSIRMNSTTRIELRNDLISRYLIAPNVEFDQINGISIVEDNYLVDGQQVVEHGAGEMCRLEVD